LATFARALGAGITLNRLGQPRLDFPGKACCFELVGPETVIAGMGTPKSKRFITA
jgi:hypothetical protein